MIKKFSLLLRAFGLVLLAAAAFALFTFVFNAPTPSAMTTLRWVVGILLTFGGIGLVGMSFFVLATEAFDIAAAARIQRRIASMFGFAAAIFAVTSAQQLVASRPWLGQVPAWICTIVLALATLSIIGFLVFSSIIFGERRDTGF